VPQREGGAEPPDRYGGVLPGPAGPELRRAREGGDGVSICYPCLTWITQHCVRAYWSCDDVRVRLEQMPGH
jgi:hypothetical protein